MPRAHGLSHGSVANENGVDRRSEESLDEAGGAGVSADEIAEGAKDCALAKGAAFLEQSRCRWCQADTLSLQSLEGIELRAQPGVQLFGAQKVRACRALALTRVVERLSGIVGSTGRIDDARRRDN